MVLKMQLTKIVEGLLAHLFNNDVRVEVLKRDKNGNAIARGFVDITRVANADISLWHFHRITIEDEDLQNIEWIDI